jgi:acetylornithine deacetylase/succinyl-diaminopimelate desuccinylase-like protein
MLNLTATMAIACRELAQASRRPPCGLVFAAVADEEAGGTWGAKWLVDHLDVLQRASGVVTEFGGMPFPTAAGVALPVVVGEKGANWCRLTVRGRPGHGSQPFGSDNALVKAAEVVRRLAELRPLVRVCEPWRRFVEALGLPDELASALVDPGRVDEALESLPVALRWQAHACTRTTVVPTVARAGTKVNVIPDRVELQVDVRILPGEDPDEVPAMLLEALGELAADVELERMFADPGSASATDTPLYRALGDAATRLVGSQPLVPMLLPGSTDARFFRELGVPSYGFGLFSGRIPFAEFGSMFHGNDERVDVASLGLSAALFCLVPERFAALVG